MPKLRIYADFNGLVVGPRDPKRTAVVIDTLCSLRDLSNAGVVLEEGLEIVAVDASDGEEDLEGHGVAVYDSQHAWWVVEFDERGVRDVPAGDRESSKAFLCITCRSDISNGDTGFPTQKECPQCGTPIATPLAPPG